MYFATAPERSRYYVLVKTLPLIRSVPINHFIHSKVECDANEHALLVCVVSVITNKAYLVQNGGYVANGILRNCISLRSTSSLDTPPSPLPCPHYQNVK